MKIPGIYKIESKIKPGQCYIGSAINITHRWQLHLSDLRKGKHHSPKLQNHYNKYGESDLIFSVLLGCNKEDLLKTEQYFFDSCKPYFNCSLTAGSRLGVKSSEETKQKLRKPKSEEHKQKLRIPKPKEAREKYKKCHKGQKAWNKGNHSYMVPWNKGRIGVYSEETIKLMTEARHNRKPLSDEALKNMGAAQKKRQERERLLRQINQN